MNVFSTGGPTGGMFTQPAMSTTNPFGFGGAFGFGAPAAAPARKAVPTGFN
jgi:hypothetical protein